MRILVLLISLVFMVSTASANLTNAQQVPVAENAPKEPCSDATVKMAREAHKSAYAEANNLIASINRELKSKKYDWHTKAKLRLARTILRCAKWRMPKLKYVCMNIRGFTAQTFPILGREVILTNAFETSNSKFQMGTILHEATHKCGANDLEYFSKNPKEGAPRSSGLFSWATIADTYSYWVEYGFCVPGYGC